MPLLKAVKLCPRVCLIHDRLNASKLQMLTGNEALAQKQSLLRLLPLFMPNLLLMLQITLHPLGRDKGTHRRPSEWQRPANLAKR